jgi:hypothetical protein
VAKKKKPLQLRPPPLRLLPLLLLPLLLKPLPALLLPSLALLPPPLALLTPPRALPMLPRVPLTLPLQLSRSPDRAARFAHNAKSHRKVAFFCLIGFSLRCWPAHVSAANQFPGPGFVVEVGQAFTVLGSCSGDHCAIS